MYKHVPTPHYVVLDTCVLISNTVRKLLIRMGQHQCISPVWGEYIGVEWRRNIPKIWDVNDEFAEREWNFMQQQFPAANMGVVHEFEKNLRYSDKKDHHVIACGLSMQQKAPDHNISIITWNLRDFVRSEVRGLGLYLYSPDQLLAMLWPEHKELMLDLFEFFAIDAMEVGCPELSIPEFLKRERLYALKKLYEAELEQ
ncbi:MAG: PIN domain-containing protein [Alcaligenaceae bacterium]|jgi:hypothetical protein|nr:PIN domain-containing protein [Alcaligenaceae bacterium]